MSEIRRVELKEKLKQKKTKNEIVQRKRKSLNYDISVCCERYMNDDNTLPITKVQQICCAVRSECFFFLFHLLLLS